MTGEFMSEASEKSAERTFHSAGESVRDKAGVVPPSTVRELENHTRDLAIPRLTIDMIDAPAYLVNNRFELEWANELAYSDIFEGRITNIADIADRNIFKFLLRSKHLAAATDRSELLGFHLAIAKKRLSKPSLFALNRDIEPKDVAELSRLHDQLGGDGEIADDRSRKIVVNLAPPGVPERYFEIFVLFFREGIFFSYHRAVDSPDVLLQVLSRRDIVIRDLLKRRQPYLTDVAVLVADLQDSTKICAELPPEQYFQLINDLWQAMEKKQRKHFATHGKHVGDGVLYYFLPQPDSNYALNALECAWDMHETMASINREWARKKNWLNRLVLNIGLHVGQEWFGTLQTPTHFEFTVLGDAVNITARLSDFARNGSILASKQFLGKLTEKERSSVRYGVRRDNGNGQEILVPETYARIENLVDLSNPINTKLKDISNLAVTEIVDLQSSPS